MRYRQSIIFFTLSFITALTLSAIEPDVRLRVPEVKTVDQLKAVSLTDAASTIGTTVGQEMSGVDISDDHNGNGHHPEMKLFGKSMGILAQFGVTVFNFLLFFGILFFTLKGALSSIFKTQKEELKNRLSKSEQEKEEAQRQIEELEIRMVGLQQELDSMIARTESDAKAEQNQILELAKTEAAQILSQVHTEIEILKQNAKSKLHDMVMELVVTNAAQRLTTRLHGDLAASTLDRAIEKVRDNK